MLSYLKVSPLFLLGLLAVCVSVQVACGGATDPVIGEDKVAPSGAPSGGGGAGSQGNDGGYGGYGSYGEYGGYGSP
jgi:hypothetical protein